MRLTKLSPIIVSVFLVSLLTACGSGGNPGNGTGNRNGSSGSTGSTPVTLLAAATASDKLTGFELYITGFTLTDKAGKSVTLIDQPAYTEFMHLNGSAEPLVTVSVPQDTYTSATASVDGGYFICQALTSTGSLENSTFDYNGQIPPSQITIQLPTPVTISSDASILTLNLFADQSAVYSSCIPPPNTVEHINVTPTFTLTASVLASQPTNAANGLLQGLSGLVSSVSSTGFTVKAADSPTFDILTTASTTYQGVTSLAGIAAGMPISFDASLQQDGSLLASRISVLEANATDVSMVTGLLAFSSNTAPGVYLDPTLQQGYLFSSPVFGSLPTSYSASTNFAISEELSNLATLPFTPAFSSTNMVPGQNLTTITHGSALPFTASTMILTPQTVNATVSAVSQSGIFNVYTVQLSAYSSFPELAIQPDQATLLTSPSQITVYADSNTQRLNSSAISVGTQLRFRGLIFNDSGTLRMDAEEIADGVQP